MKQITILPVISILILASYFHALTPATPVNTRLTKPFNGSTRQLARKQRSGPQLQVHPDISWYAPYLEVDPKQQLAAKTTQRSKYAPLMGQGITIVMIDTGIAGFYTREVDQGARYKHPFIEHPYKASYGCLNLNELAPIYECMHELNSLTKPNHIPLRSHTLEQWLTQKVTTGSSPDFTSFLTMAVPPANHHKAETLFHTCAARFSTTTYYDHNHKPQPVIREFLATTESKTSLIHGTHSYGLLKGGGAIQTLCPKATIIMLRAYNSNGYSDKAKLIKGFQKALDLKADIVICALKLANELREDTPASQLLYSLIQQIPYTIAAAGNEGAISPTTLAYPARFKGVWSAGAFALTNNQFTIPSFSQYEPGVGPHFLMPGVNVQSMSIGAPYDKAPAYTSMSGTSTAATILAGYLALILAEAEGTLTKLEIATILAQSGQFYTNEWAKKSLHGTPDIPRALITTRQLKHIKKLKNSSQPLDQQAITHIMNKLTPKKMKLLSHKTTNELETYLAKYAQRHYAPKPATTP